MKGFCFFPLTGIVAALYQVFSTACNWENHDKIPEKYEWYQPIDSTNEIESGAARLELLLESEENIQSFLTEENDVIIYTVHGKRNNTFYKLGIDGEITDSLRLDRRGGDLAFVKGFIIDKEMNEYYTWSFNGNKVPIKIRTENARLNWDTAMQKSKLAEIKAAQSIVLVDYRSKSALPEKAAAGKIQATQVPITFTVLTYFNGDQCFQFYTTLNTGRDFPWSDTQKLLWNNLFRRPDESFVNKGEITQSATLIYRYFHRLKKEKIKFSGPGGNAAGFTAVLYPGYLFTDIVFHKDTIKIKEFMYLDEERPNSSIKIDGMLIGNFSKNKVQPLERVDGYMYYTNPHLRYALFANSDKKLYRIRKKRCW